MAAPPYRRAPNVFEQYSRLGEKVGAIPQETVSAFFRGKEFAEKSDIQAKREGRAAERHPEEVKTLELTNEKIQAELDKIEADGRNTQKARDFALSVVKDELGDKFTPQMEKQWRETLELAKDWKEIDKTLNNFLTDRVDLLRHKAKSGKSIQNVETGPKTFAVTGSAQYGAARRANNWNNFKQKDLQAKLQKYENKFGDKGNSEGAIKFVGGDELGFETVQNKETRDLIKDEYESITKERNRQAAEERARISASKTTARQTPGIKHAKAMADKLEQECRQAKNPATKADKCADAQIWRDEVMLQNPLTLPSANDLFKEISKTEKKDLVKFISVQQIYSDLDQDIGDIEEVEEETKKYPELKNAQEFYQLIDEPMPAPKEKGTTLIEKAKEGIKTIKEAVTPKKEEPVSRETQKKLDLKQFDL